MERQVIYMRVVDDLKDRIKRQEFEDLKLPDERSLAESYGVSRSSIKRALNVLAQQGIIFKKRGSGTFVNPLYWKNQPMFQSLGKNLGVSDSYRYHGEAPAIRLVDFKKEVADAETQLALFLKAGEEVYQIKRLRLLQGKTFMIEKATIPVKLLPEMTARDLQHSMFQYTKQMTKKAVTKSFLTVTVEPSSKEDQTYMHLADNEPVTKSFLTVTVEPSSKEDQTYMHLADNEPVGVMAGIYFLDDGTPFEVGTMRIHYQYMQYNSFDSLDGD